MESKKERKTQMRSSWKRQKNKHYPSPKNEGIYTGKKVNKKFGFIVEYECYNTSDKTDKLIFSNP